MALATRSKPPAHHKKRVGKHHKTSAKQYVKPYLPYLPIAAIMLVGFLVSNMVGASHAVLGEQADLRRSSLLQDTNQQRAADSEATLSLNDQLNTAAQAKAEDMVARNYWSHNTPDGKQPWSFMTTAGYTYQLAGENLAYGFSDADAVITAWMNSPEHRANILNAGYHDIGFGIASSPNFNASGPETVVVAMYGSTTPVSSTNVHLEFTVPQHASDSNVLGAARASSTRQISFVQLLTKGEAPWSIVLVAIIGSVALTIFVIRHGRMWRTALRRSEVYVASHPWFDVFIVTVGTLSFILSRSVGFIR